MCTYTTVNAVVEGSAKGPQSEWFKVSEAAVYFDHPVHAMAEHTLNIDLRNEQSAPSQRVALELTAESATALVVAIQSALAEVPEGLKRRPRLLKPFLAAFCWLRMTRRCAR